MVAEKFFEGAWFRFELVIGAESESLGLVIGAESESPPMPSGNVTHFLATRVRESPNRNVRAHGCSYISVCNSRSVNH